MDIKVLGSGCANCRTLEARTVAALDALGVEAPIQKVTDFSEIASWGVMSTPALVVDDHLILAGRVPSVDELATILKGVG